MKDNAYGSKIRGISEFIVALPDTNGWRDNKFRYSANIHAAEIFCASQTLVVSFTAFYGHGLLD